MKINKHSLILLGTIILTSCSQLDEMYNINTTNATIINGFGVTRQPMYAEYDVKKEKVISTNTLTVSSEELSRNLRYYKISSWQNAMAATLKEHNADFLVNPVFETNIKEGDSWNKSVISTTVTGFPAIYTSFRPVTEKDAMIMETLGKAGIPKVDMQGEAIYMIEKDQSE
jgi:hypothetical protein